MEGCEHIIFLWGTDINPLFVFIFFSTWYLSKVLWGVIFREKIFLIFIFDYVLHNPRTKNFFVFPYQKFSRSFLVMLRSIHFSVMLRSIFFLFSSCNLFSSFIFSFFIYLCANSLSIKLTKQIPFCP